MSNNKDKEQKLKAFIASTTDRMKRPSYGAESFLTDERLSEIEIRLKTGIYQKYVYTSMGIPQTTWEGWKKKGDALIDRIRDGEIEYNDLNDQEKRYAFIAFLIATSKSKAINSSWKNMKKLAKDGNYKANEYILRVMGGKDFTLTDQLEISPGIGNRTEEDSRIENEMDSFRPVNSLEELVDPDQDTEQSEAPDIVQELDDGDIEI